MKVTSNMPRRRQDICVRNGTFFPIAQAFTLIEMLLVIVLISIVSGSLVVSLSGRQDTHSLSVAAKDLATAIRFTAAEARIKHSPHRIAFHDEFRAYRIEATPHGSNGSFAPVGGLAGAMKRFAKRVRVTSVSAAGGSTDHTSNELVFLPDRRGFDGSIELQNQAGETVRIEVLRETAQVNNVID